MAWATAVAASPSPMSEQHPPTEEGNQWHGALRRHCSHGDSEAARLLVLDDRLHWTCISRLGRERAQCRRQRRLSARAEHLLSKRLEITNHWGMGTYVRKVPRFASFSAAVRWHQPGSFGVDTSSRERVEAQFRVEHRHAESSHSHAENRRTMPQAGTASLRHKGREMPTETGMRKCERPLSSSRATLGRSTQAVKPDGKKRPRKSDFAQP